MNQISIVTEITSLHQLPKWSFTRIINVVEIKDHEKEIFFNVPITPTIHSQNH